MYTSPICKNYKIGFDKKWGVGVRSPHSPISPPVLPLGTYENFLALVSRSLCHLAMNVHYTKFTIWTPKLQILAKTLLGRTLIYLIVNSMYCTYFLFRMRQTIFHFQMKKMILICQMKFLSLQEQMRNQDLITMMKVSTKTFGKCGFLHQSKIGL